MSAYKWLWAELKRRLGPEVAEEIHQQWLVEVRREVRRYRGSSTPPDAPKQKAGRKPRRIDE